jgi:hypothetical protein
MLVKTLDNQPLETQSTNSLGLNTKTEPSMKPKNNNHLKIPLIILGSTVGLFLVLILIGYFYEIIQKQS